MPLLSTHTINMKLLFLSFLLTVHCCTSVSCTVEEQIGKHRLEEILIYINAVQVSLKNEEHMINTPPEDTENCCCLTALECFRTNLLQLFNVSSVNHVKKLTRSLNSSITKKTMNFCNSNSTMSTCQDECPAHPKKSAREFLQRLESLIQRAITQLLIG